MKKTILSLTLLLVFSTNINAKEIIYEKSQSTKELERLSNWYFNEYLVEQKKQEKLLDNKSKNIKSNNNVNYNKSKKY